MSSTERTGAPISAATATDRLLVVDHDESDIQSLRIMLENLGFEIVPAPNGEKALERLAERPPDLILIVIPGMDGFELCKRIQENHAWADIPIIFFSPTHDKDLLVRALESGGADYVSQPFDKAELLSRIRTHLMLKTARHHLKQLAVEKDELLSMISHYLQNQLAGMNMSARLLLDRTEANGDPKLRLMAENIWASSNLMRSFIKTLLANAAADRGFKISLESVDFSAAVARTLRQYEDVARTKEIALCHAPLNENGFVDADPAALEQILDNLISNAIKFSPPGRKIFTTVQPGPGCVECRIRDEGPGFSEEDKARMFHRYVRLSARPTGGEPSTGLGLSIAKRMVQAMNGALLCESSLGQGATFILRFPASHPAS
jgi:two-component system sensor histidine kinase/response regulator